MDKLTAARIDELRKLDSALEVKDIFHKPTTYGIYLSGDASKLHKKFRQYLRNNADFVANHIKSYSQPLKVSIPVSRILSCKFLVHVILVSCYCCYPLPDCLLCTVTEGTFVCACVRRTMRGVRTQN